MLIFWGGGFDYNKLEKDLVELKIKVDDPNIWKNPAAKLLFKNIKILEKKLSDFSKINESFNDLREFYKMAVDENDQASLDQLLIES